MDKTVNTHASNGALVKQSLPLPRTLFSEGGSVVFSELLAESTFRPERFALDFGVKKADLPSRAAQKAEPPQNSQDCLDCRQDEQKEILRGLNEQRAHDSASRERQELSQGAQRVRDEQARLNAETETRLVAQRQVQQRQEEQYRAEQTDRLTSQRQNSFDNEQEARSLARRSSSEGVSREREVQQASYEARANEKSHAARADDARADEKSRAAGRDQRNAERAPDASNDNRNRATTSETSTRADTDTETHEQTSLATHKGEQEGKSSEGNSVGGGKDASQNAKGAANDKQNDKQEEARVASETPPALSEDKTGKQKPAEETLPATTAEDKLENALAGLAEAEGIDIFALQDKHAQTAQAVDKDAAPLAPSLTTQGVAQEGELASSTRRTQQTGTISDTLVSRTGAGLEKTDAATTNPVAQNPATQEGKSLEDKSLEVAEQAKAEPAKAEQAKGVQEDELRRQGGGQDVPTNPDAANAAQEGRQKASVASVAALPLVSAKQADSVVRDNAAKILAQAQQLAARAEERTGFVAQKFSSATGDKPSTTTSAASDGSKESYARASDENTAPKNSQARSSDNAATRHLAQAAEAQRAAGNARQAGEAATSTPRSAAATPPPPPLPKPMLWRRR